MRIGGLGTRLMRIGGLGISRSWFRLLGMGRNRIGAIEDWGL